ncbi:D-alanyl-D-alanine carboxypeptidase [Streptomyces sp. NPDC005336]|uniref:D-alanyl-D-alanine carboxypeptidase n=1 Tax=Streptomyces sp. NPDC005336 TaxID=3157035 RepID=UPI00339DFE51
MAGESPGRSDQQKSSGETARGDRDPRLAVSREGEAAGGASAVAVAPKDPEAEPEPAPDEPSAGPEAETEVEPEAPAAAGGDEASGVRDGERGDAFRASEAAEKADAKAESEAGSEPTESASGLPTRPMANGGERESETSESEADSAEKAEKSSASDESDEGDAPEGRDVRLREAVAAWVATADEDDEAGTDAGAGADEAVAGKDKKDKDDDKPSIDQRTAVFRTVKPRPAADDEPKNDEPKKGDASDADGSADDDAPARLVDRPTAAFGVLREKDSAGKGSARGDDEDKPAADKKSESETSETKDEGGTKSEAGEKGVDQPTTAIKAIGAPGKKTSEKKASDETASGKAASDTTASGKAASGEAASGEATSNEKTSGKKPIGESDNERTSKFVPLRSADAPAPTKPSAPPAKPSAPPAKPSAPPAKPSVPPAKPSALPETERTKQQPLPPATPDGKQPAPLDLLAQLTNTPPKPETPMRTAVRRVKIWTPLALLLVVVLGVIQAVRPLPDPSLKLSSDDTYSFSGGKLSMPWPGQGQSAAEVEGVGSLGISGDQKPVPIASVTKVMTAYVVLRGHPLNADQKGPSIRIDAQAGKEAGSQDESRVPVKEGQTFTERQMLELLLIPSGNNIARQLARWDAGSLDTFVKKMNDAAKDLGMKNTTYTDPSGLKETTKSTARDQLKLAKAAMQSEAFRAVVATPNIQIPGLKDRIYNNNNLLVKPGVVGIKTGSSTPAGGALMWGAERTIDGKKQRILGVVLEQRATTTLDASLQLAQTNSYKLITTVQDALTSATVIKKGDVVGQVDDGLGGTTPVVATKHLTAVGWAGLTVDIKITDGGKTVPHAAKAGTVVGELTVGTGPGQLKAPVALQSDLSEPSFGSKLTRIG